MKKLLSAYASLLLPAALIIASDQYTKALVRANLDYLEMWSPWHWLMPYVRLVHTHNTGAAFGMFQGLNPFFIGLAFVVSGVILYYYPRVPGSDWPLRIAMVLQFSGAVGNLIDRLHQGHVTDFISVGSFAVFNIADASISTGVAVLILGMLWHETQLRRNPPLAAIETPSFPVGAEIETDSELPSAAQAEALPDVPSETGDREETDV